MKGIIKLKKTIKIIDLLKIQANDEKLPKKIRFNGEIWELKYFHVFNDNDKYYDYMTWCGSHLFYNKWLLLECLNEDVEIIEEEKEEFEDIEQIQLKDGRIISNYDGENHYITTNVKDKEVYIKQINQLIRNQKKLIDVVNELKKQ